ncbi:MAG: GIY-YIG nuclease family protein [Patescibacteria group bacterium]|jgi:putative endonuclease
MTSPEKFYLYIARCADGSLYIGSTGLLPADRMKRHNSKTGAKWFTQHGPGDIVHVEIFPTLLEARQRELQLKKWSRGKKERLIKGLKP